MKKVLLLVIIAVMFSGIYAHEVTANFDVESDNGMGLSFTRGDLWWGDGTYLVDFMITGTTEQPLDFTLSQAWKKVNLWDLADFQIGRNVLS
ncbi:MAG: hypothetical protein K9N40_10325, partial [Candidatus Cloacimonetes bacterium]|nr:hypothetical protein [Candidatus Cloacimonadota bacterium]